MRKVWVVWGVVVSLLALSAAAAAGAATIPVLRVGQTFLNSSTLDPTKNEGFCPLPVCETLLTFNSDGTIRGWLATGYTQPGRDVYVFHLRHGVRFWDGSEMTSADVANALNYERYPTSQNAALFGPVRSIQATDRYTVVVTLKFPDAAFRVVLARVGPIFEKRFQDAHKTTFGQPGVLLQATGPWKVDSFDPTSGAELSANPHWWGGKVNIGHMSVKFFSDEQSEALAFRAGEIDVAYPVDARAFAATSGAHLITAPAVNPAFISMNVHAAPWSDIHVRRAVAYALDRSAIISASGQPGTPLYTLIPPQHLLTLAPPAAVAKLLKSVPVFRFNLAKAKAEMAKSAYPNGFSATTDTFEYGAYVPMQEVIVAELQKIGINLKVNVVSTGAWVAELAGPKDKLGFEFYTDALGEGDPSLFPSQLLGSKNLGSGEFNTANYAPPAVDQLIKQGLVTQNPAKRLAIYGQLLRRLAADLPLIPLFNEDASLALSSKFVWPGWNAVSAQYTQIRAR
jgi:peptide/nickel transport system substrate-binding protein